MQTPDVGYPPTIAAAIRRAAAEFGDHEFIVMPDRRMTYAQAEAASRRVAKELLAAGVGKATRVGVLFTSSTEWVVAWLAVTRIGALLVPFGSTMKPPELRRALRHSDVQLLMVPPTLLGRDMYDFLEQAVPELIGRGPGPHFIPEFPFLREVRVCAPSALPWASELSLAFDTDSETTGPERVGPGRVGPVSDELVEQAEAEVAPSDLMVVIYTSGATSAPKGVVHTHAAQVRQGANLARNFGAGIPPDERCYCSLPFFWIGGLTFILMGALHTGTTVLCNERFDAGDALDLVERERATRVAGWQPMLVAMTQHPTFAERDLGSVEMFNPPEGVQVDPELRHYSLGMTETSGPHTACPPAEADRVLPEELRGSFGAPLPGLEHRIVDPDTGADLPEGEVGEILVRGYSVMDGMYKRERHEVFDDDGWYHTGDRGTFREGYLFFKGRLSEMIKTAGANVAPREVEVVIESFAGVQLALVVGVPDTERGELVTAVVVPEPGAEVDVDALTAHLRAEIASYKVPRRIVVSDHDDVPWLPTGKPDKRELITRLTTPPPN